MNCLLLSNNGIALNLPPSLGGSVANYNYMLKLDMIYKQAVVLPSNINNKEVGYVRRSLDDWKYV
ncbi:TPA: hypothetical protein ACTN7Q_000326 [Campylobacter jejuni]